MLRKSLAISVAVSACVTVQFDFATKAAAGWRPQPRFFANCGQGMRATPAGRCIPRGWRPGKGMRGHGGLDGGRVVVVAGART